MHVKYEYFKVLGGKYIHVQISKPSLKIRY